MKRRVISILLMLLISATSFFSASILADWNPGDEYKMHFPQLPDPTGWDVNGTIITGVFPYTVLADDWLCTETGYVTDIHFWGSWFNDIVGDISAFCITIFADIPTDYPLIPYSRPGEKLWYRTFSEDDWLVAGPWEGVQGWYDPYQGFYMDNNHFQYWQYNIENIEDPFLQVEDTVYWISVSAKVASADPQPYWGWKSSDYHWNDNAVYIVYDSLDAVNESHYWINLTEPPSLSKSLDFSFVIDGEPTPINHPPDTPSKPNGPSSGEVGEWLLYTTSATDPDEDYIKYGFDFNYDDTVDEWTPYYHSGVTCAVYIRFGTPGTCYIQVIAKDTHGATSDWSPVKMVVITGVNQPPTIPRKPSGPSTGTINVSYTFQTNATDTDGDEIRYGWDWNGDDVIDEWTDFYTSGETVDLSHHYFNPGTYYIRVIAEDEHGAQSTFSSAKTIAIVGNNPPNKPAQPTGAINGYIGISYMYSSMTTDPEGNNIFYLFDWGDGTRSEWIGPYSSGSIITASHTWFMKGTFPIKVKAKDDPNGDGDPSDGKESVWSESFPIIMPKSKQIKMPFLEFLDTLLKDYPRLFPLLRLVFQISNNFVY